MHVLIGGHKQAFRTVTYDPKRNQVRLIDQRLLPHTFQIHTCSDFRATALAIQNMTVRGAGAIGATAAYGFAQGIQSFESRDLDLFEAHVNHVFETLATARPTAVDPVNAMQRIQHALISGKTVTDKKVIARKEAERFAGENIAECQRIGAVGRNLIREGMRVLTHCNAGWLAFVDYGTATAPLYAAQADGVSFHVYCDETRPRCQGASLTAWELYQQGVSHEIIADNAAGHLMQRGEIDLVLVGSDRVPGRTGAVANKIGTYTKAVLARRHNIPFYVAIPHSTLDWEITDFRDIPIEERSPDEVLGAWGVDDQGKHNRVRIANPGSSARNPGFDVTPPELITGIITPDGIFEPGNLPRP